MRKYIITVNGKKFEVEVEEVEIHSASAGRPAEVVKQNQIKMGEIEQENMIERKSLGQRSIKAPIPGTIFDIKITKGQSVKKGDVLFILEAMKMENEIMAGEDGIVSDILVSRGASVNTNDVLAVLD